MVSMYMPCSAYLCTKFTKDRMIQNMNWVEKKICNYLWKNNWFHPAPGFEIRSEIENINRLTEISDNAFPVYTLTKSETEWRSYALEIAFHDKQLKKYILSNAGLLKKYSATFMSFTSFLSPLFAALYGWAFFQEIISWHFYVSAVIVFTGLYIFYQDELRKQKFVE